MKDQRQISTPRGDVEPQCAFIAAPSAVVEQGVHLESAARCLDPRRQGQGNYGARREISAPELKPKPLGNRDRGTEGCQSRGSHTATAPADRAPGPLLCSWKVNVTGFAAGLRFVSEAVQ